MRSFLPLLCVTLLLAGCASSSTGQLNLHVTDAPDAIGDFTSLTVTVDKIVLHGKDAKDDDTGNSENETDKKTTYTPATDVFDLTKLAGANVSTIFKDQVAGGSYKKLTLYISDARGVLKNGTSVPVRIPSGRIFIKEDFTVAAAKETDFLFDVQVHLEGNGEYALKPNATDSGAGKKGGAETAAATPGKSK